MTSSPTRSIFLPQGTYTALVTPFKDQSGVSPELDEEAFARLVEEQIANGITGLVPCGTTGESPTLNEKEHLFVIEKTVKLAKGRVPVLAGTGSNSTAHAIHLCKEAEKLGADAVMVVVPYYNKPSQEGLFQHYTLVAKSTKLPVVVYNIPGRTGIDLTVDTLARIAEHAPNVIGVKEATGNVLRAQEILAKLGSRLQVFCGDDALTLAMCAVGASGVISVTSNFLPKEVTECTHLALAGKFSEALHAHRKLLSVHEAMFLESNPSPVKAALQMKYGFTSVVRPPLAQASAHTKQMLSTILKNYL